MAKIQEAELNLNFVIPTFTDNVTFYVDLARELSKINRKMYRQGKEYFVQSVQVLSRDAVIAEVATAPNNWVCRNALKKSFFLWNKQNKEAIKDSPSGKPTWYDFKIYLEDAMRTSNIENVEDIQGTFYVAGEWDYSNIVEPVLGGATGSGDEFALHLLGADNGAPGVRVSAGMIVGYQQSRALIQSPDPDLPANFSVTWMNRLDDTGSIDAQLLTNIEDDNDQPPYSQADYPGGAVNATSCNVVGMCSLNPAFASVSYMNGFSALHGLLRFDLTTWVDGTTQNTILLRIKMLPGKYKGVAALPI